MNSPLSTEIETKIQQISEQGTRELMNEAIALFKTPHPSARKDAVEKIWNALERLKSYYAKSKAEKSVSIKTIVNNISGDSDYFNKLFDDEFRTLTDIGNNCFIRHSEVYQTPISDTRY